MESDQPKRQDSTEKELDFFGARHAFAVLAFFAMAINMGFRVILSVTIVAMVNMTSSENQSSISDTCPVRNASAVSSEETSTGEFDWDERMQGIILGSYFYGYIVMNIPGGVAAERFGGRLMIGLSITVMALLILASPWAARVSGGLLIFVRMLQGCASGIFQTSLMYLISNWYPKQERSKFMAFICSGLGFGTLVCLIASGWLCSTDFLGGWPSAFYTFGVLALVWVVFWFWLAKDRAEDHPRISDAELKYIIEGCPPITERVPTPWKSILSSKYFWTIAVAQFGQSWGYYTILTEIPTYFDRILHIKIQNNGLFTALPEAGALIFANIVGLTLDRLMSSGVLSLLSVRRIAMAIGGYVPVLCLIGMCFVNCHVAWALTLLFISGTITGSVFCGYISSYGDLSPRFSGVLSGLSSTFAGTSGFIAPLTVAAFTNDNQTLWAWRKVFLITAIIYLVTTTVYIIFITTETQPWNEPQPRDDKEKKKVNSKVFATSTP